MLTFVKPGAILKDDRSEVEKRNALLNSTADNVAFMAEQLVASGHSLEQVIAWAAQHGLGITLKTVAPKREEAEVDTRSAA